MAKLAKFLQGVAGAAGGAGLNVEEVFSTYLYEGNSSTQTITNGIDLSGEGGLIWIKQRTGANSHYLHDSEMSSDADYIKSDSAASKSTGIALTKNNNGFTIGSTTWDGLNATGNDYASFTFRKAPKFFDVVTYTGNGSNRSIAHNLGCEVGMMIVKCTSNLDDWWVYHRGANTSNAGTAAGKLNETAGFDDPSGRWNSTAPTDTHFYLESGSEVNGSGRTYVAYLFAHNNGDGEFGPTGDQDIIKCGSFTANSGGEVEIDVGFEPQWILTKSTASSGWFIFDAMRGMSHTSTNYVQANESNAEAALTTGYVKPTATGWIDSWYGGTPEIIYIAIRRGPMAVPESATDVFAAQLYYNGSNPQYTSNFPVDMGILKDVTGADGLVSSRLTQGKFNYLNTDAETTNSTVGVFDYQDGFSEFLSSTSVAWMWKRAPNFFDAVAYTGDSPGGVGVQTISHNLGVAPEMIWFKRRDSTGGWGVLVTALGTVESGGIEYGQGAYLNETSAFSLSGWWGSPYVAPTATEFTVRGSTPNASGGDYIAYLFASLAGVSKVGSYSGTGSAQNIDCGFSSGARFVLIKGSSFGDNWWVFDTERGIVAGNDPRLYLNTTDAQFSFDYIDPYSAGFTVNSFLSSNGQTYIFYAIA